MNREILFRGRLSNGKWAYGNLQITKDRICIITPDDTPIGKYGQVEPDTVGQYTELCDKNGRKIFEGDAIKSTDGDNLNSMDCGTGPVEFYAGLWYVCGDVNNSLYDIGNEIEIIGNIHDNPELGGKSE